MAWSPTRCRPRSAASRCVMRSPAAAASARNSRSPRSPSSITTSSAPAPPSATTATICSRCCRRADGSVALRNITTQPRLLRASPVRARARCWRNSPMRPLDNAAFPWLTGQVAEVGLATDVYLLRVNFVGALGWELHFPIEYAHHLFDAIFAAGAEFGIGMAGMRAMESLRLEKSYRMWGSDLTPDYTPYEAGLDRFVRLNKGAFIGKEALEKQLKRGRAAPLHHVRSARRHGCRSARQRAAVRWQGQPRRARDGRLLWACAAARAWDWATSSRNSPRSAASIADRDPRRAQARHGARRLARTIRRTRI